MIKINSINDRIINQKKNSKSINLIFFLALIQIPLHSIVKVSTRKKNTRSEFIDNIHYSNAWPISYLNFYLNYWAKK